MHEKSHGDENMVGNLELLTVEELETLIEQEMLSEENIDVEYLKELADAVKHKQQYPTMDAQQALDMFKATYATGAEENVPYMPPKGHRKTLRILWIAAAVVALLCTVVFAQAVGIDIFNIFGFWSDEYFYYGSEYTQASDQQEVNLPSLPPEKEFASLQEVFAILKIRDQLLPTWQPEGFELAELYTTDMIPDRLRFEAFYQADDYHYSVDITLFSDLAAADYDVFQKDDSPVDFYSVNGYTAYVFSNLGETIVTWMDGHYMIAISGNLDTQILIQMAESIYL